MSSIEDENERVTTTKVVCSIDVVESMSGTTFPAGTEFEVVLKTSQDTGVATEITLISDEKKIRVTPEIFGVLFTVEEPIPEEEEGV